MFDPQVVDEKLSRFEKEFGWRPEPHSIEEVDAAIKRLGTAFEIDAKGTIFQTRELTKQEAHFIANERAMCVASCLYFLTLYYWIKAKNRIMRFTFRQGQWILWQMLCFLDRKGVSKMLQILKARQLGISTLAEGIATWVALFVPGAASQIGSADGQKTQIMLGMMTLAIDQLPPWLPPTQTRSKTASDRAILEFSHIGSLIMVQPGSIRGGMGQGSTPTMVHLSECSQYTNPVKQLDEGLFKSLHEGPELVVLLESTGDASHQSAWWWKEMWITNRDNYWTGNADFLPVFLPWHTTPELYPGPWLKKHPMPTDFVPNEDTVSHIRRAEAYVRNTKMLSEIIGTEWTMPLEQQWYWQFKHEDHKRRRVEKSWYRQMPCLVGETRVSTDVGIVRIDQAQAAKMGTGGAISAWWPRGKSRIYELSTKDGRRIRGTAKHLVRCVDGPSWKELSSLQPGESVVLQAVRFADSLYVHKWNDTPIFESSRVIDEKVGRLLGYFMGDGCFHQQCMEIACDAKDLDTISDVTSLIAEISGRDPHHQRIGNMVRVRSSNQYWVPFLKSLGAIQTVTHSSGIRPDGWRRKVCVPECIYRSPRSVVKEFLSALYECDGHGSKGQPQVTLASSHDEFLREIQILLLGFGVNSVFRKQKKICGGTIKGGKRHEYTQRELAIRSAFANDFYELIGFAGNRKQNHGKRRISEKYAAKEFSDVVESVVDTGEDEEVYDLTTQEHLFDANGLCVHNSDDYEALLGENDKVYSEEAIEVVSKSLAKHDDMQVYMLAGDGVETRREPPEGKVWYGSDSPPRLKCHWKTPKNDKMDWMFVPLLREPEKGFDPLEKFLIFEEPREGFDYSMGVDTGTGVGGDRSVINVTRYGSGAEPDMQVAEFAADSIPTAELYAWIAATAALYSRYMKEKPHPKIAIEMRRKFGDLPYHQTRLMGFRRWHEWGQGFDRKTFEEKVGKRGRIGWFTNEWSRLLLLSTFQSAVENGWYVVRSKWLADELKDLEQRITASGKTRVDHESGKHDDRVFAAAMAYITLHQRDVIAERSQKRYDKPEDSGLVIEHGPPAFTVISSGGKLWEAAK